MDDYTKALFDVKKFFEENGYSWSREDLMTIFDLFIERRAELKKFGEFRSENCTKKLKRMQKK